MWARNLYHSTALIDLALSRMEYRTKSHGKAPYQKPQLKSMAHRIHPCIAKCISAVDRDNSIVT